MHDQRTIYSSEAARGWLPWGLLAPFIGAFLVIAPLALTSIVLNHLQLVDAQDNPIGSFGFHAFLLLPFSAIGLSVFAWIRFVERRSLATIGLKPIDRAKTFVIGHLVGVAMACIIVAGIWISGGFAAGGFAPAFNSASALPNIGLLLAGFIVQSSVEEAVFRGWLLSVIARRFNIAIAIGLSSLLFCALHYDDPHQPWLFTANTFLFAVFACCWAVKADNIWGVMGWHAGWNWMFATGFELKVTGLDAHMPALLLKLTPQGPDYLTGGAQGPEGSWVCTVVLIAAIALVGMRRRRPDRSQPPARLAVTFDMQNTRAAIPSSEQRQS